MELALQTAVNAIAISFLYALMAVGFALIYGILHIPNLAHGELYMVAAVAIWAVYGVNQLPFPLAVIAGIGIAIGIAIALERGIFRPLRGRFFGGLIGALGASLILQTFVLTNWHAAHMVVPTPVSGRLEILGAIIPLYNLTVIIPAAAAVFGWFWFFLKRTRSGQALRAVAQDSEIASLQGVTINRVRLIALIIGGALAGVGGALAAPIQMPHPFIGHPVLLIALMATIVGGLGSVEGAFIAAFIYGFLIAFVTTYMDGVTATIAGVLFMFVILVVRPRGLLGRA